MVCFQKDRIGEMLGDYIYVNGEMRDRARSATAVCITSDYGGGSFKLVLSFSNSSFVNSSKNSLLLVLIKSLVYIKEHFIITSYFYRISLSTTLFRKPYKGTRRRQYSEFGI